MNSRGQAMAESAIVLLILTFLLCVLFRSAYVIWADFVIDRECHRMVLCALSRQSDSPCETVARTKISRLLRWGNLLKVNVDIRRDLHDYYEGYGDIRYDTQWGLLRSERLLNEKQILKDFQQYH